MPREVSSDHHPSYASAQPKVDGTSLPMHPDDASPGLPYHQSKGPYHVGGVGLSGGL